MVALETPNAELGAQAVDFLLKGTDGKQYSLSEAKGEHGLMVMFICNHCPFVQSRIQAIIEDAHALKTHGVNMIAIMSNDAEAYPEDNFDNMKAWAEKLSFPFPYVIDETQEVAKSYGAVCTPDFFGYNGNLELQYRGRLNSEVGMSQSGGEKELLPAMIDIAQTGKCSAPQYPSIGCSIKWKDTAAA